MVAYFRASMATLLREASLLPQIKRIIYFLGHGRVFILDFLFQDLGILSRISLKKNWSLKLSQKASELREEYHPAHAKK